MRRWIAILLLALLPFQLAWAGAVDPCAHADGSSQHSAAAPAGDADGDGAPQQASPDAGCEHCPCHAVGLVGTVVAATSLAPAARLLEPGPSRFADTVPALPERPQWADLA